MNPGTSYAGPLLLSLKVSVAATLIAFPFALAFGRLLARRRFPGRTLLETLLHLPLVLPPVATGYFLLLLFARQGPAGRFLDRAFGISLVFTWPAAAIASAVIAFPLMLRAVQAGLEAVDPGLPAMARTLGCSRSGAFLRVTLPLALPGLLSSLLLGFARSLGEFGATMLVAGNIPGVTRTLPLAIFNAVQVGEDSFALRLCLLSVLLCFAALAAGNWVERRLGGRK